jgi:hypothetical protein
MISHAITRIVGTGIALATVAAPTWSYGSAPRMVGPRPSLAETYEAKARYWEERSRHYAYGNAKVSASRYRAAAEEAKALELTQPLRKGAYPSIAAQESVLAAMAEGASRHYRYGTSVDQAKFRRTRAARAFEAGLTEPLKRPVGPLFGTYPRRPGTGTGVVYPPPYPLTFRRVTVGASFGASPGSSHDDDDETADAQVLELEDGSIVYVLEEEPMASPVSDGETVWVEPVGEDAEGRMWVRITRAEQPGTRAIPGPETGQAGAAGSIEIDPAHADPNVLRAALARSYSLAVQESRVGQGLRAARRLWALAWYVEACLGEGIIPVYEGRAWQERCRTAVARLYAAFATQSAGAPRQTPRAGAP